MIDMQGGGIRLELTSTSTLEIDAADESPEMKIRRLINENPAVIFSRSSCYMCHFMKRLLSTLRVHPIVIELEERLPPTTSVAGFNQLITVLSIPLSDIKFSIDTSGMF